MVFYNPVSIHFGLHDLKRYTSDRRILLVTSAGSIQRGCLQVFKENGFTPDMVFDSVRPNPQLAAILNAREKFADSAHDCVVAFGGGSVIDTAKALAVQCSDADFLNLVEGQDRTEPTAALPIIAIPTVPGSGSELTPWATIWNFEKGRKNSIELPALFPRRAFIAPQFLATVPEDQFRLSICDALSHCFESLWNKNRTASSEKLAFAAIHRFFKTVPAALSNRDDTDVSTDLWMAVLESALAFSQTKTALAHAVSYPLTLFHGVPHGLATSFSLPAILESVLQQSPSFATGLGLGVDPVQRVQQFLEYVGVDCSLSAYRFTASDRERIEKSVRVNARGANFAFDTSKSVDLILSLLN